MASNSEPDADETAPYSSDADADDTKRRKKSKPSEDDILKEAKEAYEYAVDHENENRVEAMDDLRFARLADQWPAAVRQQREREGRPCLTVNRIPTFIRQVVNDARQNKPAITVHPVDSDADPMTAEILNGIIRNIEYQSNADVAYDTALESAATNGFGYWRINTRYATDSGFEQDIVLDTVANPFSVYGDPNSTAADSADWMSAFVVDLMPKKRFAQLYKGASQTDWEVLDGYTTLQQPWMEENRIRTAEYWKRTETKRMIVALSNGEVVGLEEYEKNLELFQSIGAEIVGMPRPVPSYSVCQYLMSGAEVLQETEWGGHYIPIVPVYGDEVNVGGVRHFRSLVRDAKDPQRMFNYWRTMATELVALAPKAPYIGPKGAFETDIQKWETSNSEAHAFMEYDLVAGGARPERQAFAGVPAGALQEALNAADDLKSVTGIFDASLGARGNETSGRAILLRQKEGDTATFHYIDNLSRAIRHSGRIIIDLIPKVYSTERVLRILGPERQAMTVPVNQPVPGQAPDGTHVQFLFDLTAGKYDVTVEAGPSFSTKREESANQMLELIRAFPQSAMVLGDLLARNLDWPGADQVADRMHALLPPGVLALGGPQGGAPGAVPPGQPGAPPGAPPGPQMVPAEALVQMKQQADAGAQQAHAVIAQQRDQGAKMAAQIQQLQMTIAGMQAQHDVQQQQANTQDYRAETERLKAVHEVTKPSKV